MRTLTEIEADIAALPSAQVAELAAWIGQRQSAPSSGGAHDGAGLRSISDFFGCFASGQTHGADNARIDEDLAREADRGL